MKNGIKIKGTNYIIFEKEDESVSFSEEDLFKDSEYLYINHDYSENNIRESKCYKFELGYIILLTNKQDLTMAYLIIENKLYELGEYVSEASLADVIKICQRIVDEDDKFEIDEG